MSSLPLHAHNVAAPPPSHICPGAAAHWLIDSKQESELTRWGLRPGCHLRQVERQSWAPQVRVMRQVLRPKVLRQQQVRVMHQVLWQQAPVRVTQVLRCLALVQQPGQVMQQVMQLVQQVRGMQGVSCRQALVRQRQVPATQQAWQPVLVQQEQAVQGWRRVLLVLRGWLRVQRVLQGWPQVQRLLLVWRGWPRARRGRQVQRVQRLLLVWRGWPRVQGRRVQQVPLVWRG